MSVYGLVKNGELTPCKAKPENRGVGNCTHYEHFELSREQAKYLNREHVKNFEKKLAGENREVFLRGMRRKTVDRVNSIPAILPNAISSHEGGKILTREEFNGATIKLASALPDFTSKTISSFYKKLEERTTNPEVMKKFQNNVENIYSFLMSEDVDAKNIRDFLGAEVELKDFSKLLVINVNAMVKPYHFERKNPRMKRILLTTLNNDMNRERYVASVLYFGGRCCYCNRVLSNSSSDGKVTASGEHLTPVTPEDRSGIYAGTRYGNMALSCLPCNNERGSKNMEEWINSTKRISSENKPLSLQRIKEFRRFALYSEYTQEQSDAIVAKGAELQKLAWSLKHKPGGITSDDVDYIRLKLNEAVGFLREEYF